MFGSPSCRGGHSTLYIDLHMHAQDKLHCTSRDTEVLWNYSLQQPPLSQVPEMYFEVSVF